MDQEEIELPYHVPMSFKTGERVKVIAQTKAAHAWYGEWSSRAEMWFQTNLTLKVLQEDRLVGFLCEGRTLDGIAWLPSCALVKASAEACVIEVPFISEGGK